MKQICICPVTHRLSAARYGKSYNILNNLEDSQFKFTACVGTAEEQPSPSNVEIKELGTDSRLSYYRQAFAHSYRELQTGHCDVLHHMHLTYLGFNPALIAVNPDTPVVIGPAQISHDIPEDERRMMLDWIAPDVLPKATRDHVYRSIAVLWNAMVPLRKRLFRRTLACADRVVTVNEETREQYARYVDESKLEVIPLGVDTEYFSYKDERETGRLCAVGRLIKRKGFSDLLHSFEIIRETFSDAELHILGEGPQRERLQDLAYELGISDAVKFHGNVPQSQVRKHFEQASVFVHPSHSESFSPVRLEAMSTGCPIVATNVTGASEMIRDGIDGYVVPIGDVEKMADAVVEILSSLKMRRNMGQNGRERVESVYDWEHIGESYLDVYRSVLK